ncbi:MAG: hypothetical protein WCG45_02785 [bacterium]
MKINFKEWLETQPEAIEEGWMKNLAVGGALLGAGMGLGRMQGQQNQQPEPQQNVTQQAKPMNAWQYKKMEIARQRAELQRKTQGMKSGQSRTFVQGQIQDTQDGNYDKDIESSSITSPDAADYFK